MTQRVLIATPCQDQVAAGFALDLAKLIGYTTLKTNGSIELVAMQNRGTIIPQQRQVLAKQALALQCSHILWIDSDMRFPKDALLRLLEHQLGIVGANYPMRRAPILPTAKHHEHGHLFTMDQAAGLAEVSHAGMGLMLTETQVFQAMQAPWFTLGYSKAEDGFVGEDVYFCRKAKEAGFPTYIDQALSHDVKHIGEIEFTHQHALLTRDAMLGQPSEPVVERKLEIVKS